MSITVIHAIPGQKRRFSDSHPHLHIPHRPHLHPSCFARPMTKPRPYPPRLHLPTILVTAWTWTGTFVPPVCAKPASDAREHCPCSPCHSTPRPSSHRQQRFRHHHAPIQRSCRHFLAAFFRRCRPMSPAGSSIRSAHAATCPRPSVLLPPWPCARLLLSTGRKTM